MYVGGCFSIHLFNIFGLGLPTYFSNHSPSLSEHIFVGFKEFTSLMCWYTAIHHHQPQGPTLFRRARWDFTCVQFDMCTDMRPPVSKFHLRRLCNVQLIPYPRWLQQNKGWEWELNLCPSASTGSQVQFTTPWLPHLTTCIWSQHLFHIYNSTTILRPIYNESPWKWQNNVISVKFNFEGINFAVGTWYWTRYEDMKQ